MFCLEVASLWYTVFFLLAHRKADFPKIYEDAEKKYAALHSSITDILNEANSILFKQSTPLPSSSLAEVQSQIFALNTIPNYPRREVVEVHLVEKEATSLRQVSAQVTDDQKKGWLLMSTGKDGGMVALPKGIYASPRVTSKSFLFTNINDLTHGVVVLEKDGVAVMSNDTISLKIKDGRIASVYDKILE